MIVTKFESRSGIYLLLIWHHNIKHIRILIKQQNWELILMFLIFKLPIFFKLWWYGICISLYDIDFRVWQHINFVGILNFHIDIIYFNFRLNGFHYEYLFLLTSQRSAGFRTSYYYYYHYYCIYIFFSFTNLLQLHFCKFLCFFNF